MRLFFAVLWLIPAILLVRRNSAWTPVAMVALTVSLGALVRRRSADPVAQWRSLVPLTVAGGLINVALLAAGMGLWVAAGDDGSDGDGGGCLPQFAGTARVDGGTEPAS